MKKTFLRLKKKAIENEDVIEQIVQYLRKEERGIAWLRDKTGLDYNNLYAIFAQRTQGLTNSDRSVINKSLKTSF